MKEVLSGWGATAPTSADVDEPDSVSGLAAALRNAPARGVIARGLGRSYGDAAQNAGGRVVRTTRATGIGALDQDTGAIAVEAGVSVDALMRAVVPQGRFVPVTPGTRHVTVGGAIAADIHGKNHHRDGAWCLHVARLRLLTPSGVRTIGPATEPELFWATAGGMGLTGIVAEATLRLPPIETSRILVDTDRTPDLDSVLDLMAGSDDQYRFSVAWIDLMARGRALGRSVLTRGDFAPADRLPAGARPLAFAPRVRLAAPPFVPGNLLNRASIRAFNEAWFRRAPRRRRDELQTIGQFFHPLDAVAGWNRLYGRRGVLQWQPVVPFGAEDVLRGIIEDLSRFGCSSFLTVLKRFGPADPGPLSFPIPGWTLSVDIPAGNDDLGPLLDNLDERVADAGGRVYLAKDSRLRPELVPVMYPRLDEWRAAQRAVDPEGVLCSDLARRLRLLSPRS